MTDSVVEIDIRALDEALIEQPTLAEKYGRRMADSKREVDESKADLEVVEAELKMDIASRPEAYGIAKTTESIISATVITQKKYKVAKRKVIEAEHVLAIVKATCHAIDHRKAALGELVSLMQMNYCARPKVPPDVDERLQGEQTKRAFKRAKINKRK